jgi:hypothetical protein
MSDLQFIGAWQPFATAPKDRPILVAWGTVASGALGWDIVKHRSGDKWESENSDDILPAGGFIIISWMPLPDLPKPQTTTEAK